jgi:type II secretory ATPase GspE/PulE/Tfp pilus assembly ATPase PilB-like protein
MWRIRQALTLLYLWIIATPCWAQDAWPAFPLPALHQIDRGPGGYLSWIKLLLLWVLFLAWVKTTDWVSQDCQRVGVPYAIWNPLVTFPFLAALVLLGLSLPLFLLSFPLCVLAYVAPLIAYVMVRNQRLELHERVLTIGHIRHLLAEGLQRVGVRISAEPKAAHEKGAPVNMIAQGGKDPQQNQANLIEARQSAGYLPTKELIAGAIDNRAEKVMLDFSPQEVTTRYLVDGVWHDAENHERDEGDAILAILKKLAGLKPQDRASRQQGRLGVEYNGHQLSCTLVSQGTKTGERALLGFSEMRNPFRSLEELGMRPKMVERLKELMLEPHGILLFSSLPSGGLSTTLEIALKSTDRLLRDFIAVEDENDRMHDVENVDPITYNRAAGETPDQKLDSILRKQPDVLVFPDLVNAATVTRLCAAAVDDKLVFGCVRAKEAVEALLRILLMKVPAKAFAPAALAVVNQRLVRKLCESCKEAYAPPPALLAKLGVPAGRVDTLYRHPENPEKECPDCRGIGYLSRTCIFELLVVDDAIRQALLTQPKLEVLRAVSRRSGNTTLQEEGLAKVIQGITSLPELMRVLKQ